MAECVHSGRCSDTTMDNIKAFLIQDVISKLPLPHLDRVHIVKRNKNLKSGDLQLILPFLRRVCQSDERFSESWPTEELQGKSGHAHVKGVDGLRTFSELKEVLQAVSEATRSRPAEVQACCFDVTNGGDVMVKLHRPSVFKHVLSDVEQKQTAYGTFSRSGKAIVNSVKCFLKTFGDDLTIFHLRSIVLAEHVKALLIANGYTVESLGSHYSPEDETGLMKAFFEPCHKSCLTEETLKEIRCDIKMQLLESPYHCEDGNQDVLSVDLRKFIQGEEITGFDKNIDVFNVMKDSQRLDQLCYLEQHTKKYKDKDILCVHVVSYEQNFVQQQIDICWQILSNSIGSQVHVVYGTVVSRGSKQPLPAAKDYIELRKHQMMDAFTIKYGDCVKGPNWSDTIMSLTVAGIKFELLTTACRQTLKLDVSEDGCEINPVDSKGGVFVLYNCARLSNLFHHFQSAVEKGIYPPLPAVDTLDYSLLREEEEWALLWNYVIQYPVIVKETMAGTKSGNPKASIPSHKICQFLLDLSRDLSSYYSRVHVLVEPRSHLYPVMYARLHLLRAVQRVFHNALGLLGIPPISRL